MRLIKSFVRREGRQTASQQEALARWSNQYLLPVGNGVLPFSSIFGRDAPLVVEIGFGMGHSLWQMAERNPEQNFIGIEVYRPGIGALVHQLQSRHISNVRILAADAAEVLSTCFEDESLAEVQIFFPDPWPKKRHHKRRLIQLPFVQMLRIKLRVGGYLRLATDWADYAQQMLEVLTQTSELTNTAGLGQFSEPRGERPVTKYESRGYRLGHAVWELEFQLSPINPLAPGGRGLG